MPRAMGLFRKAGFDVVAYPVDYRTRGPEDLTRFFERIPQGCSASTSAPTSGWVSSPIARWAVSTSCFRPSAPGRAWRALSDCAHSWRSWVGSDSASG